MKRRVAFSVSIAKILLLGVTLGGVYDLSAQTSTNSAAQPRLASSSSPHDSALPAVPRETAPTDAAPAVDSAADTRVGLASMPTATPKDTEKTDASYVIGIADDLQISVWKEPDLSGPVVVRPDGMITLPVINDVHVDGLTTKQVQDILTEKLRRVVNTPQVTVIVRNIRSRKVFLVGQVGHPGALSLTGHETVLQVVAESGGLGPYAKAEKIYILRRTGGHQEKISFNYRKAIKGGDPKSDFQLETGDVIVVP
jgi:polysaccharide export outer membrane protein